MGHVRALPADIVFMLCAVNSHAALVSSIKEAIEWIDSLDASVMSGNDQDIIRAVLRDLRKTLKSAAPAPLAPEAPDAR